MDYKKYINKEESDVMPIFYNAEIFNKVVFDLSQPYISTKVDKVIGIESRGFILGGALARELNVGFVAVRKAGKLKQEVLRSKEFIDYSGTAKSLEIQVQSIAPGERVIIVDDWFETGNQANAVIDLLEQLKAKIVGISVIMDETPDDVYKNLMKYGYHWLVKY